MHGHQNEFSQFCFAKVAFGKSSQLWRRVTYVRTERAQVAIVNTQKYESLTVAKATVC